MWASAESGGLLSLAEHSGLHPTSHNKPGEVRGIKGLSRADKYEEAKKPSGRATEQSQIGTNGHENKNLDAENVWRCVNLAIDDEVNPNESKIVDSSERFARENGHYNSIHNQQNPTQIWHQLQGAWSVQTNAHQWNKAGQLQHSFGQRVLKKGWKVPKL